MRLLTPALSLVACATAEKIHFPKAPKLYSCLSESPYLNSEYYRQQDITETAAKFVSQRFSARSLLAKVLPMQVTLVVYDLQTGVDGYSGEKIQGIGQRDSIFWKQFSMGVEAALMECTTDET